MGLVNKVVPLDKLEDEYVQWAEEMIHWLSPLALRMIKAGLNARVGRTGRYTRVGRRRYHALLYDGRGAGRRQGILGETPSTLRGLPEVPVKGIEN